MFLGKDLSHGGLPTASRSAQEVGVLEMVFQNVAGNPHEHPTLLSGIEQSAGASIASIIRPGPSVVQRQLGFSYGLQGLEVIRPSTFQLSQE